MYRGVIVAHDRFMRASALSLVLALVVVSAVGLAPARRVLGASSLTLEITIYRARLSYGDSGSRDGVGNLHYYVYVYEGVDVTSVNNTDPVGDRSDWTPDTTHSFSIKTTTPIIVIQLLVDEPRSREAVVDISGYVGGGGHVLRGKVPRGAEFHATYNLTTNKLSGDRTELENGYFRTSGDYDGSASYDGKEDDEKYTDQNDADLWFRISDNYETPTASVISSPQSQPQSDSPTASSQPEAPQERTYSPDVESSINGISRIQIAEGIVLAGLLAAASFLLVARRP